MFEFTFKNISENGSFAGKTIVLPTPSGNKQTIIDTLPRSENDKELDAEYLMFKNKYSKKRNKI